MSCETQNQKENQTFSFTGEIVELYDYKKFDVEGRRGLRKTGRALLNNKSPYGVIDIDMNDKDEENRKSEMQTVYNAFPQDRLKIVKTGSYGLHYYTKYDSLDDHPDKNHVHQNRYTCIYKSDKFNLEIIGADTNALDMLNSNVIEGNYPQKINEIMVEQWVINKMEHKPAIGDKISLDYEMINTKGLSIGRLKTEFVLSGIMDNSYGTISANKGKAYVTLQTTEQYIEKYDRSYSQYFAINTSPNIRQELIKVRESLSKKSKYENQYGDYKENSAYVDAIENAYKSRKLIFLIDAIVEIFAVMVIYNVFNISVMERLKHFGLLRTIGATTKQIKYMLLAEALLLGAVFIPIGVVAGVIATPLLFLLISKVSLFEVNVKISLFNIILPFIMGFLSILIAVYISAKLGARVSPIEAINTESKIRKKQTDMKSLGNKLILSIYGQMGKMALTNIGRYKKRFYATVVTISISIALFISVFYLVKSLDPVKQISSIMPSDYVLSYEFNTEKRNGYSGEAIRKLENIEGIEKINKLKYTRCNIYMDTKYLTEAGKEYFEKEAKFDDYVNRLLFSDKVDFISFTIVLNEEKYNEYFKDKEETSSYKGQGEALPNVFIMQDINYEGYTNLKPGDPISIEYSYKENNKWKKTEQDFIIKAILDKAPLPISKGSGSIAVFMKEEVLQKYYPTDGYQRIEIYLEKGADVQEIEAKLKDIASSQKYGKVESFREYIEMIRKVQTQLALVLYSIVVVISLVGLINIVNTMSMNILLRKREFGILRAIGITKLQLREMIFKEGLFGSLMGIGLIYVIYSFGRKILFIEFEMNYLSIIFASTVTVILCITATIIPIKRVTSASVVESIGTVE